MAAPDPKYISWLEEVTGGTCVGATPPGSGASRSTWLVDVRGADGVVRPLTLRLDTGDGPLSETEISLAREGSVYQALQGAGVPVAAYHALSDDGKGLILGRVPGESEWYSPLPGAVRESVGGDFARAFAKLHSIDIASLDLPLMRPLNGPLDGPLNELAVWEKVVATRVRRTSLPTKVAFRWLRKHAPECHDPVLCHGDVGPGNFMFQGDRLTALVDWEFAHFGDPMDDFAWMTIRGGAFEERAHMWPIEHIFRTYEDASGRKLDRQRIRYYQVFVLVRMAIGCLAPLDNRKGGMNANIYFGFLPTLETTLARLMAEIMGTPAPALPAPPTDPGDELGAYVEREFIPALAADIPDPHLSMRLSSVLPLIANLRARVTVGNEVEAEGLALIKQHTGRTFATLASAEAALGEDLDAGRLDSDELVPLLAQLAVIKWRIWPGSHRMNVPRIPDWVA